MTGTQGMQMGYARLRQFMQDLWILDFIPKANGSHWRMSRRKVRCLDLFIRVLSTMCGSCSLPAYSCQTLCNPAEGSSPAPLSMEFSRQEYWSGFPFSSFIVLLPSVTLSTFYFFFKAYLFCLCWFFIAVSGLSLVAAAVHRLLLAVASLVLEHRL